MVVPKLALTRSGVSAAVGRVGWATDSTSNDVLSNTTDISGSEIDFVDTASFSGVIWCYPDAVGAGSIQSLVRVDGSVDLVWRVYLPSGVSNFRFGLWDGASEVTVTDTQSLSSGNWYCVVWVYDQPNARIGISVNGNGFAFQPHSGGFGASQELRLFNNAGLTHDLNGRLTLFSLYSRALNIAESVQLYNSGIGRAYPFVSQVHGYTMSVDDHNAIPRGSYGEDTIDVANDQAEFGNAINALLGAGAYFNSSWSAYGRSSSTLTTFYQRHLNFPFSFGAWVIADDLTAKRYITAQGDQSPLEERFALYYDNTNDRFQADYRNAASTLSTAIGNTFGAPAIDTLYWVVGTFDGNEIKISVNGGAYDTAAVAGALDEGNDRMMYGGDRLGANTWDGEIYRLTFWPYPLSEMDCAEIYNSGTPKDHVHAPFPAPSISNISPTSVSVNDEITIEGNYFLTTQFVRIGGIDVPFEIDNIETARAIVPVVSGGTAQVELIMFDGSTTGLSAQSLSVSGNAASELREDLENIGVTPHFVLIGDIGRLVPAGTDVRQWWDALGNIGFRTDTLSNGNLSNAPDVDAAKKNGRDAFSYDNARYMQCVDPPASLDNITGFTLFSYLWTRGDWLNVQTAMNLRQENTPQSFAWELNTTTAGNDPVRFRAKDNVLANVDTIATSAIGFDTPHLISAEKRSDGTTEVWDDRVSQNTNSGANLAASPAELMRISLRGIWPSSAAPVDDAWALEMAFFAMFPELTTAQRQEVENFVRAYYGDFAVSKFSPSSGSIGALVTIKGHSFTGSTDAQINGTSGDNLTVVDDETITINVALGTTTGQVSVVNGGTETSVRNFTVV